MCGGYGASTDTSPQSWASYRGVRHAARELPKAIAEYSRGLSAFFKGISAEQQVPFSSAKTPEIISCQVTSHALMCCKHRDFLSLEISKRVRLGPGAMLSCSAAMKDSIRFAIIVGYYFVSLQVHD